MELTKAIIMLFLAQMLSISQLNPGEEEIKKKSWWQFWRQK